MQTSVWAVSQGLQPALRGLPEERCFSPQARESKRRGTSKFCEGLSTQAGKLNKPQADMTLSENTSATPGLLDVPPFLPCRCPYRGDEEEVRQRGDVETKLVLPARGGRFQ